MNHLKFRLYMETKMEIPIMFSEDIKAFEQQYSSRFEVIHVFDHREEKRTVFF